ncbi:MAG: dipeptide ABC transporter ATP-binding protein [Albidovulum sp.]|nr:dipeptide ABC transporter ATP-binding protein [Albidovulum sp.]
MSQSADLIEVNDLAKHFPGRSGFSFGASRPLVKAVDGVSFSIERGKTFGLVGESGCGKSTVARLILRLIDATAGTVKFEGADLFAAPRHKMRRMRRNMQIIFQDPFSSLNPRMTVGEIIREPLWVHGTPRGEEQKRVRELLELVGLAAEHASRHPHEFSGGQRQRIGIARALALRPKFVICDEAVAALDVSIQSQILNLLKDMQREFEVAYLFISHNLSVVKYISDVVGVMYLGRLVECADKKRIFAAPNHPYTKALLSAVPSMKPGRARNMIMLEGEIPSPLDPPSGCRFHTRCPMAMPACSKTEPKLREVAPGHVSACLLNDP